MNQRDNQSEKEFDPNDLDWLAFCYLADEMNDAQRAEFELRLEHDELAQQSLVDAMQETRLVYESLNSTSFNEVVNQKPVPLASRAIPNNRRRSAVLLAAAAAILLLVGGWAWQSSLFNQDNPVASANSDLLASAWVDSLALMNDVELDELIEEEAPSGDLVSEQDDWMFVALSDLELVTEGIESETN